MIRRNAVKRLLLAFIIILVAVIIFAPSAMRYLALPQGSNAFDGHVKKLTLLAESLRQYRSEHKGQRPETFSDLQAYIKHKYPDNNGLLSSLDSLQIEYSSTVAPGKPVIVCYKTFSGRPVKFVIDDKDEVYAARVLEWPVWNLLKQNVSSSNR